MATAKENRLLDLIIVSTGPGWLLPFSLRHEVVNEGAREAHMLQIIKHLCLAWAQSFPLSAATMIHLRAMGISLESSQCCFRGS